MNTCHLCGQTFKTIQGMLGHQRMKHSVSGVQDSGQCQCNTVQSNGEFQSSVAQNSGQHQCSVAQDSEQSMGEKLLSRDECLGLIDASIKRQLAGMEPHVHDLA